MGKIVLFIALACMTLAAQNSTDSSLIFKPGYYISMDDLIHNTPKEPEVSTSIVATYRGETSPKTFHLEETINGRQKRVRGRDFIGYSDGSSIFFVDNVGLLSGRSLRKLNVATYYSYYFGTKQQPTTIGMSIGSTSFGLTSEKNRHTRQIQTLEIIDMKTGKRTSISKSSGEQTVVKQILSKFPEVLKSYESNPTRDIHKIALFLDEANTTLGKTH